MTTTGHDTSSHAPLTEHPRTSPRKSAAPETLRYLDNAATTQVRPEALDALTHCYATVFGNPSSHHEVGERAKAVLEDARERVARILGARPGDVIFTSGGTEANNLAIKGIALGNPKARHVVTTRIEHDSVLESVAYLERMHGYDATYLGVDAQGRVDPAEVAASIRDDTAFVSIGLANNEIGTVQPIAEIAGAIKGLNRPRTLPGRAWLHTDAVQATGWLPLEFKQLGVDALTIAGHKVGAPRGIGVAVIRGRIPLEPILHGGGQERARRSGTEHVAGAIALAVALELAEAERMQAAVEAEAQLGRLVTEVRQRIPTARLTGPEPTALAASTASDPKPDVERAETPASARTRLPNLASFVFPGTSGEAVLLELARRGVIASSGSACAAGSDEPSHVLTALGIDRETAQTSVRFTLPHDGTGFEGVAGELELAIRALQEIGTSST
ncbi:cysteine desulfurase family protein [Gulosibacter molinativorax]|uniref:cysteine desulfurase n=1 Tax=Gulosibacter molinativorax TaxID=256821 RepID=A0ABT7C4V5_9MICO|nr:cysteine desulfurase family protein [Gulosibacter molinativorax]MDJ1370065.1 cysteine desulfurase [Gulosibacter molinativorax]QUY63742.1 Cysteine desulfurase [Gulosibacter molinativorax]